MTEPIAKTRMRAWEELNLCSPKDPESIGVDAARYAALLDEARRSGLEAGQTEDPDTGSRVVTVEGGEEEIGDLVRSLAAAGRPCAVDVAGGKDALRRVWKGLGELAADLASFELRDHDGDAGAEDAP